jgi:RHS repeat-associated protein
LKFESQGFRYRVNAAVRLLRNVNYTSTGQEYDHELGFYNYKTRLYDPVLGKFLSPDSIVQAPDDPQTLNRSSYARNNPIIYTDPSGNFFIIDDIIAALVLLGELILSSEIATAIVGGAILGAGLSAVTGGNIALGTLTGAISGAIFFGAGEILPGITKALGATTRLGQVVVSTGVHAVAGAVSGGINAAISGSNIGLGMLTGAVGAGIGNAAGSFLPSKFEYQLVGQVVAGAIAGGIVSALYGGNFWSGFGQGAYTAALGFLFNQCLHFRWPRGQWIYGEASYYLPTGNPTASGEPYGDIEQWGRTAAMHGVPYGTQVTVEYLDRNGRVIESLTVRVNDHGPWERDASGNWVPHSSRIIDLSRGVFLELVGGWERGVAPVRVYIPNR